MLMPKDATPLDEIETRRLRRARARLTTARADVADSHAIVSRLDNRMTPGDSPIDDLDDAIEKAYRAVVRAADIARRVERFNDAAIVAKDHDVVR